MLVEFELPIRSWTQLMASTFEAHLQYQQTILRLFIANMIKKEKDLSRK